MHPLALILLAIIACVAFFAANMNPPHADYRQDTSAGTVTTIKTVTSGAGEVQFAAPLDLMPAGAVWLSGASGTQANTNAVATLAAAANVTTYVCGFTLSSTGSTAASVVSPTLTGIIGGTHTYTYASVAGVTLANQTVVVNFPRCVPASAVNTAIVLTLPALGAGSTNATSTIWGYRL